MRLDLDGMAVLGYISLSLSLARAVHDKLM